jgi:HlyD family secretion protein
MTTHSMDRPRTTTARPRRKLAIIAIVIGAALLLVATLRPAAPPALDRAEIVIDTVRRGEFVHEVVAAGTLVAEEARLLAAPAAGRIEIIRVQPGDRLKAGDVILELWNRETRRQLLEVEQQVAAAEAELADLAATLKARSLESEKALRHTRFERRDAQRQAEAGTELARAGLMPELEATRRREAAEELEERVGSESARHDAIAQSADAQMAAARNRVERMRALLAFHRGLVESLVVRAPSDTTVRDVAVQPGEWANEGQRLARLVEPARLKAVLLVPEAVAHEVRTGQRVTMSARGASLAGEVARIAAAVEQGTLAVDVKLVGTLPPNVRPELSVDGRVELGRVRDALSISRTARAAASSKAVLYKVDRDGRTARRTAVQYGMAGADRIVVAAGAAAGERFIVAGADSQTAPVIRIQ